MRIWLVNRALDSVNCADNNHAIGLWNSLLDASRYRVDSRLVTIDGLGMLLIFYQVPAFSSLVGGLRYVLTRDRMTTSLSSHTCALMWLTHLYIKPWTAQDVIMLCSSRTCLTDPNLLYCGKSFGSGAQFSIVFGVSSLRTVRVLYNNLPLPT